MVAIPEKVLRYEKFVNETLKEDLRYAECLNSNISTLDLMNCQLMPAVQLCCHGGKKCEALCDTRHGPRPRSHSHRHSDSHSRWRQWQCLWLRVSVTLSVCDCHWQPCQWVTLSLTLTVCECDSVWLSVSVPLTQYHWLSITEAQWLSEGETSLSRGRGRGGPVRALAWTRWSVWTASLRELPSGQINVKLMLLYTPICYLL